MAIQFKRHSIKKKVNTQIKDGESYFRPLVHDRYFTYYANERVQRKSFDSMSIFIDLYTLLS